MKLFHQETAEIQYQSRNTLDFPQHLHNVLEIVFMRSGTATVISGGRRYPLQTGDIFLSFPNLPHGYEDSRDVTCDVVIIPATYLSVWRSQLSQKLPICPILPKGSWEATGLDRLMAMVREERKKLADGVKQGYALVIAGKLLPLVKLADRDTGTSTTLQILLQYLSDHYREPLSRRELARAMGYNESYISHLFSQQLGTTLKDYLTSLRLRDARELLTETDMTVSQISLLLGFGSIRSFNRAFAAHTGTSPTAYRIDNRSNTL